MARRAVLRVD